MAEAPKKRLDSWKEIADYLGREVRTAIRWERDKQLPIHRVPGGKRQAVFAYTDEIDAWLEGSPNSGIRVDPPGHDGQERSAAALQFGTLHGQAPPSSPPQPQASERLTEVAPSGLALTRIAVLAIGVGMLALILTILQFRPLPALSVSRCVQVTSDGVPKVGPLFTDGPRLYFNELIDAKWTITQVSVKGGQPVAISPAWRDFTLLDISPDGSVLLAQTLNATAPDAAFWLLPLPEGTPQRLGVEGHTGAFSPDGQRLAYFNGATLYAAKKDGSEPRRLIAVEGAPGSLRWSPDGATLRFDLQDKKDALTSPWEVSAEGSDLRPVSFRGSDRSMRRFLGNWAPDGSYFLFQSGPGVASDLWVRREKTSLLRRADDRAVRLTTGPIDFTAEAWSRDGRSIFALGDLGGGRLARYDSKSRKFVPYLAGMAANGLAFSPDGEWVAYTLGREPTLWRSRSDGSERMQLTFPPLKVVMPRWSPDGRTIAFVGNAVVGPGRPKIYLVSPAGGKPEELIPDDSDQANPTWSADGKSLAFAGAPWLRGFRPDSTAIHILDFANRQVSTLPGSQGLWAPKWSPDGNAIAAQTIDSEELMLFDVGTSKWRSLKRINKVMGYPCWSHDGSYIYFNTSAPDRAVYRLRVSDGLMELIVSLKDTPVTGALGEWFGLSPDDSLLVLRDLSTQEIFALDVSLQ